MPTTALPASIPDSQLGLSASEIHILRQNQQIALAHHQSSPSYAHSTASSVSRGRGHARTSASTSRAASAASSQQQAGGAGRLLLDPGSLAVLGQHFERLMGAIQNRVEQLTTQTHLSTLSQSALISHTTVAAADAEIARFHDVLRQIDELELEFDKVRHIRDIVKGFRARVEGLEKRVDGKGGAGRRA